ncbi:FAD-dependent oxidoreductase [Novosphingobium terrae]|uniref:FAD-dependent oxidoreductase n=1 Tax=Novosphingobium terrae TaxID=2726189 RepID=UPI00197EB190|nr:FAD-dependent oxidoreductase [Novosphingobium terrae]
MTATNKKGGIPVWRDMGVTPNPAREDDAEVVIVGGGPVGLTLALDLGRRGRRVLVLNKRDIIAAGSKAICFSKRTLDIWNRLGVGKAMVEKGVVWNVGKVFWGAQDEPVYSFDMLPVKHQQMPAFINLQQYHAEEILIEAVIALPNVTLRWGHEVTEIAQSADSARLTVRSDEGAYCIDAPWVAACDGSTSPLRHMLGLDFEGRIFEDNFLIADIRLKQDRPAERWFWFDPPFNPGQSALLHKQPDDVWRLDFQLGWNIDREACIKPENVAPYVRGMLGEDVEFKPEWYSVYTFQCRRMARFVHDRVIFAGDSAHLVSPFGARGCNGGVADADNLGWKLDLILRGEAPEDLLESYNDEAIATADENILNSSRSTDFLTPKSETSTALRNAVLELSETHAFARPFVNSGRLSTAVSYPHSPLSTEDGLQGGITPGSVALDAPVGNGWLLDHLGQGDFVLLSADGTAPEIEGLRSLNVADLGDSEGLVAQRYAMEPGAAYLIRPDHYVAARWHQPSAHQISAALQRAKGLHA